MAKIILSIISGLLVGLSFNFNALAFLVWFSLVPFIGSIYKNTLYKGSICAMGFAFAYYATAIFWVSNVTKLGLVFLIIYLSLYYVLFFILARNFLTKNFRIITIPCLWVLVELLKEHVWCGFGWANLGYSQYSNFYLIQPADLGGVKLISFLIVMVNVLIWDFFLYLKQKDIRKSTKLFFYNFIIASCIIMVCYLYSFIRLGTLSDSTSFKVFVVQPNISQELKWNSSASGAIAEKLKFLIKKNKENGLVILPEAAWPFVVDLDKPQGLKQFVKNIHRNILVGAVAKQESYFYNTALLFDKRGELVDFYKKIRLVPFGEYVPLRNFFSFISVVNTIGDMSSGDRITKFSYKDKIFSVLICFEDIFPLHVLRFARGSDFLVNITNDAWFGGEPEASQHLAIMTFRAVENRISIIRSSNTGISGWVSFRGEIDKLKNKGKEVFFAANEGFDIVVNKDRSFYNKHGEIFALACGVVLLIVFIAQKGIREKLWVCKKKR